MPERSSLPASGSPRIYTIEVCAVCGGQLSNRFAPPGLGGSDGSSGRCGVNRSHWSHGGVLLDVTPTPHQPETLGYPKGYTRDRLIAAGVIPSDLPQPPDGVS